MMQKKLKVGITGATGYLGTALTRMFISKGHQVVALVRNSGISEHNGQSNYCEVAGDINNFDALRDLVKQVDVMIHLAAYVGHGSAKDYHRVNVVGTEALCTAITRYNPRCKMINCSSIATLRYPKWFPWVATVYARTKAKADKVVAKYQQLHGLQATTVYPGLIFGPGDTKFVPKVIEAIQQGKLLRISGGEKNAPLIYIDDLCQLFYLATTQKQAIGEHYIGVKPLAVGIHSFFDYLAIRVGKSLPTARFPKWILLPLAIFLEAIFSNFNLKKSPPLTRRVVDILSINLTKNTEQANNSLGWMAKVDYIEGLDNYFES